MFEIGRYMKHLRTSFLLFVVFTLVLLLYVSMRQSNQFPINRLLSRANSAEMTSNLRHIVNIEHSTPDTSTSSHTTEGNLLRQAKQHDGVGLYHLSEHNDIQTVKTFNKDDISHILPDTSKNIPNVSVDNDGIVAGRDRTASTKTTEASTSDTIQTTEESLLTNVSRRVSDHAVSDSSAIKPTAILLLTYMRSGSSLTGDILQHNEDTFYAFEPFRILYNSVKKGPVTFLNGTVRGQGNYSQEDIHRQALHGWLTCNFNQIYVQAFNDPFLSYGKKTSAVVHCLNKTSKVSTIQARQLARQRCIKKLEDTCKKSKFRIVKTIRTTMKMALSVMREVENMKIIHLVRDPRATLKSQTHRGVCPVNTGGLTGCARRHCQKVATDSMLKHSAIVNGQNIFTVKYEDIASYPVQTTHTMYEFTGLEFNESVKKYVFNVTLGGDRSECQVCQLKWQIGQKHDSSLDHINAWKSGMSTVAIFKIQTSCRSVLMHYGYEMFYRNYNNSSLHFNSTT